MLASLCVRMSAGIFLHVLADTLGSAGVIVSTLMIRFWGWHLADPIASLIISVLILLSVISLVTSTANILLSRVPEGMEATLKECLVQVRAGSLVQGAWVHIHVLHVFLLPVPCCLCCDAVGNALGCHLPVLLFLNVVPTP
jgi:Co/Zn/Cd efflux system component